MMSQPTTYYHINPRKRDFSFDIKTMQLVYEQSGGKADHPHRHDYFTILLIKEAVGVHKIDFQDYPMAALQVYFINPGQVHQVIETQPPLGWVITFSRYFLVENGINESFISDINLFRTADDTQPLKLNEPQYLELDALCAQMSSYLKNKDKFTYEAVSAYLKLFLIACNKACVLPDSTEYLAQASPDILKRFKMIVTEHYTKNHMVIFYADMLSITADHLNKVVKSSLGISAKDYILKVVLLEAKRLLIFSDLNFKEIGYALGFNDPAYFSNYFKRHTGESLSAFRKTYQK